MTAQSSLYVFLSTLPPPKKMKRNQNLRYSSRIPLFCQGSRKGPQHVLPLPETPGARVQFSIWAPGGCRTIRTEAKIRGFENRFQLVCSSIAVAMGQKGDDIWDIRGRS